MNAHAQDVNHETEQEKPLKKPGLNLGRIYQRWKLRLLIHRQIISTTLAAIFGVLLALYHHADIDIYLIGIEWLICLSLILALARWQRPLPLPIEIEQAPAPLCHIIFVGKDYTAKTEYYETNISAGRVLAEALEKARKEGVQSVTYYENQQQFHIPVTAAASSDDQI